MRNVAIIGTCPSSRMLAPFGNDDWEIWTCSPDNVGRFPRINWWFELHGDIGWEEPAWALPYLNWINANTFPVYAQDKSLIPRATIFPVDRLLTQFGYNFFTSQPAWMMAMAIDMGAPQIALFGIDGAAKTEYHHQKPGILYFAQVAHGRGIKVLAPPESEILMPPPLYGYNLNSPMGRKLRVRELEIKAQVQELDERIEYDRMRRQHLRGCLDDIDYSIQTFTGGHIYHQTADELVPLAPVSAQAKPTLVKP